MSHNEDLGDEEEKEEQVDMEIENPETGWNEELRLVLIGKTGSGKSASGNTILGQRQFLSRISASSVTQICQVGSTKFAEEDNAQKDGHTVTRRRMRRVTVVDMPGFGDTHLTVEQIHAEIAKCISLSAPGPHAFLLVVPIGRYTDNENQAARELTKIFGDDAIHRHTVVLFTRGDDLEGIAIEEYLSETAPAGLKALIGRCGGRYHVFNNKDPSNSEQVKELLKKVEKMAERANEKFYTNAMFLEAEAAIREEEKRMLRERVKAVEEEQDKNSSMPQLAKQRKGVLESDRTVSTGKGSQGGRRMEVEKRNEEDFRRERWTEESRGSTLSLLMDRVERCRDRFRGRHRGCNRALNRQQSHSSSWLRRRREAALSAKVLERVKVLVAAGATGMAVGAMFGAAAPLAAAAGASFVGNAVGFAAGQFAGMSAAGATGAVGAIAAAAAGKTAMAVGAATGGVLGGSVGAVVGTEAASPQEGALVALGQVSVIGASAVAVATGVGVTMGAGAALGAALDGAALSTAPLSGAESASVVAAGVADASGAHSSLASAVGQHAVATAGSVAAGSGTHQCAAAGATLAQEMAANVPVAAGSGAMCGIIGPSVTSASSRVSDPWGTVAATTQILTAVTEIGKAAAGIALAGGLVVKVVKEKIRCGTRATEANYSEKTSYEVHWNK